MRSLVAAVLVGLLAAFVVTGPVLAAAPDVLVTDFDSPGNWAPAGGIATIAGAASESSGSGALAISYDVTAGSADIASTSTLVVATTPATSLSLDLKGDGTYNTVYLRLADASGELFMYRVDAMRSTAWMTLTVDLSKTATLVQGGDGNGILDLPVSLERIMIGRNGAQPAVGVATIDNLRLTTDGWTAPTSTLATVNPGGAPTTISFFTGVGDYELVLSDDAGHSRTFSATASSPQPVAIGWDGRTSTGVAFRGTVAAVLSHDSSADSSLSSASIRARVPALASVVGSTFLGSTTLAETFDTTAADWVTLAGSVSLANGTDRTQGANALKLAYNVASSNVEIERKTTPRVIATQPISAIKVDLKGDSTYNTVYLKLKDASGELLMYRVASMATSSWTTVTIDLTIPPVFAELGNSDSIIDYPVSLARILVSSNGSQPATGVALLDNLRTVSEGWTMPVPSAERFSPAEGESIGFSFTSGDAGDYRLTLGDQSGRSRTFSGMASSSGQIELNWDGRDGGGALMSGPIASTLRYDTSANGNLSSTNIVAERPFFVGASDRATLAAPTSIVGVNSFLTTIDSAAEADRQAALMEDAYVRFAREEFDWNRVEKRKGFFDWAKFDQAVTTTYSRNIDIIGKLAYSALWASSAPSGTPSSERPFFPPTFLSDYTEYATAVVSRYKDRVHVWEIWNEQNSATYWKPGPDAAGYAAMLKATYAAIKAVDPTATVLIGGLVGFSDSYMQAVLSNGAGGSFDGLAIHTYSNQAPETGMADFYIEAAQAFLKRNSLTKSLWITEVGWTTCTSCSGATTESAQADYLSRTFLDAAARGISGVTWYAFATSSASATSRLDNFGVMVRSGRLKPAYTALQDVGAVLHQSVAAGFVAPQKGGGTTLASDMATTTGLAAVALNGGSASIAETSSRWAGAGGIQLDYNFSGGSTGAVVEMSQQLPGQPSSVSLWVYGDGSNNPIYLAFTDAKGERFQALVGHAAEARWNKLTMYSDGANPQYNHAGGNNDGRWDYPLTMTGIFVYKGTSGVTSGTIFLDDLSVGYASPVRGTALIGPTGIVQAVYTLGTPTTASVSIPGRTASLRTGLGESPLTVVGGKANITLSARPMFVASGLGVTPTNGAPGRTFVATWLGGNTYIASAQVYGPNGFVRTLFYQSRYSAGVRVVGWNGRSSTGALATPGEYIFRVWLHGATGATTVVSTPFTVAAP